MDIASEKGKIYSKIAALRVSTETFPKTFLSNSIPSINKDGNSLNFLTDLIKSLVGFDALNDVIVETLTTNLDEIEVDIKVTIKKILKELVSCNINPSIPQDFIDNGITIEVNKVDFLDIMRINPISQAGKLIYDDVFSASESTDFNTYLYSAIQGEGEELFWGHVTTDEDILGVKFNEEGLISNNTITIKPSTYYSENKMLTDFNNSYVDSVKLFNSVKLINNIIENVFGSISVVTKKDKQTIKNEIQINDIIDRVLNSDCDEVIDDSYFSFSNDELQDIDYRAKSRRKGVKVLKINENVDSEIDINELTALNDEYDALSNDLPLGEYQEKLTTLVRDGINSLANAAAVNVDDEDKMTVKLSFIEDILKKLMTAIVNVILSPKLILIFTVNHYILYQGETFENVQDFMEKNKWLLTRILDEVRDLIIAKLMERALKEIKTLAIENAIKVSVEGLKNNKAQLVSMVSSKLTKFNDSVTNLIK